MSALDALLKRHAVGFQPQILLSDEERFPPFSIQIHGLTDAPYFSASTRVRVFLAVPLPARAGGALRCMASATNGQDSSGNPIVLPVLDTIQSDAAECCAPWFNASESFLYVNGSRSLPPDVTLSEATVAVCLVDVIDRRTSKSVGCIGGCTVHLYERNGVFSYALHRSAHFAAADRIVYEKETVPLTALVVEVHWGPGDAVPNAPNNVTSKKLRAIMFGAVAVEEHVRAAACLSAAESLSREDRRRLLYRNETFRTVRPVDIHLPAEASRVLFDDTRAASTCCRDLDALGFVVYNAQRGASITIHKLVAPEWFPTPDEQKTSTDSGGNDGRASVPSEEAAIPSPSLAPLMLFRVVVEANGVVVGHTVRHSWDAPLTAPSFPHRANTFVLSEDSMMDDDEDDDDHDNTPIEENPRPTRTKKAAVTLVSPSTSDSNTFSDLGELHGVTCIARIFAMIPLYNALKKSTQGATGLLRAADASRSLPARFGYESFEALNAAHYSVLPYAWGVVDVVAPNQPFIKHREHDPITLYRGVPSEETLRELSALFKKRSGTRRTLADVLQNLTSSKKLPAPMETKLVVSTMDASLMHLNPAVTSDDPLRGTLPTSGLQRLSKGQASSSVTLRQAWLGATPECTIEQFEEFLEATFRSFAFQ